MTVRALCRVLGGGLILVGIVGFFVPHLLGMHLTPIHDAIHLASGSLALYFGYAGSNAQARAFALTFGLVYFGLGILGFVAPGVTANVLGHDADVSSRDMAPDNVVHLILGGAFMLASRLRSAEHRAAAARSVSG